MGNRVWLAEAAPPLVHTGDAPAAGRLGLDVTTGAPRLSVDIGGAPVAVSATADRVWVANSTGDNRPTPVGADTVEEFDSTGTLLHRYHVADPVAVGAAGDKAWVLAGVNTATLVELADGVAHQPIALTGAPSSRALTVCDGTLYAATQSQTGLVVTRVSPNGDAASTAVGADGTVTLACAADGVVAVIDNNDDGGLARIEFDSAATTAPTGPRHIQALVGIRPLWAVASDGGPARLLPVDPASLAVGAPYALPGDGPVLAAADADRIWITEGHELLVLTTTG